jgi:hypothetical protein
MHRQPDKLIEQPFASSAAVYVSTQLLRDQPIHEGFVEHFKLEDKLDVWKQRSLKYQ